MPSGTYFGLYLVRNATAQRYLAAETAGRQGPIAFFSFPAANRDGFRHFRLPAGDVVSIEDQRGGGDRDFNDAVIRMSFLTTGGSSSGGGGVKPPNPPAPLETDDIKPVVTLTSPPEGSLTNRAITVNGQATDVGTGVSVLYASLDASSFAAVNFDPTTGAFQFPASLALDGTADGHHSMSFYAIDRANNQSATVSVGVDLDATAPVLAVSSPTSGVSTNRNVAVAGRTSDAFSGVASLTASIDGGPATPTSFDAGGAFSLATAFPTDGSADGMHTVRLVATDRAGNVSKTSDFSFTLDTIPPRAPSFGLDPAFDSVPSGDGMTSFPMVTLIGQTDPGVTVRLGDLLTVADKSGRFTFAGVPLQPGANILTAVAVDAVGNESRFTTTLTRQEACNFEDGLKGWTVAQDGGTATGKGTVTASQGQATLVEGDSFNVTLERDFVVPAGATSLSFAYTGPGFDSTSTGLAKDAFEVALLDAAGSTLLTPFAAGRDAFFNASEGQAPALGTEASLSNGTVTVDLSGVAVGTTARLVFRLVNNDADTRTAVTLTCAMFPDGATFVGPSATEATGNGSIQTRSPSPLVAAVLAAAAATATKPATSPIVGMPGVVSATSPVRPPGLTIATPFDHVQVASGASVLLSGTAIASVVAGSSSAAVPNRIVDVTVNGTPVEVLDIGGHFFQKVVVAPGENHYDVVATDTFGQTSHATLTLSGSSQPPAQVDFSDLSDVSASFIAEYARTSYRAETSTLYADVAIANQGSYPANVPLYVGVTHLSDPAVRVLDAAGTSPDGIPYYDFTRLVVGGGTLAPDARTGMLSLAFADPGHAQFTYDLVFFGRLNRTPAFSSTPVVATSIGRPYAYRSQAEDADGDPLTYSLLAGPAGMTIDPRTGAIGWAPASGDLGTHAVQVRVDDERGGSAEQDFTLTAAVTPPDRPPVFTSTPVVSSFVTTSYSYQAMADDPDGDALTYQLVAGPTGLIVAAATGLVTWTPTATQLGTSIVTLEVADGLGGVATQTFTICTMPTMGNHAPAIVSIPQTTIVAPSAAGTGTAVNLAPWSVVQYPFKNQGNAKWTLNSTNTVATQVNQADASILLSDFKLTDDHIEGTWQVNAYDDDDLIGFVFGYQETSHYYLFDWKQTDQGEVGSSSGIGLAQKGMTVKVVNASSALKDRDLWNTAGTTNRVTPLFHNAIPWADVTAYQFSLDFHPGHFTITVSKGTTVLATIPIDDATYTGGKFGFYNYSQDNVVYSGFRLQPVPPTPYSTTVKAIDPDGEPLTYSLVQGPAGATIDPATGQISWAARQSDVGSHPVTVTVVDGHGGSDTQTFAINVVAAASATIGGTASDDSQPTATGLAGRKIFLDANNNGRFDPGESSTKTDAQGKYGFSALVAGNYIVRELGQPGAVEILPSTLANSVTLAAGQAATGINFVDHLLTDTANRNPVISGTPPAAAIVGRRYRYDMAAYDPDGDPLTFSLAASPLGMAVDPALGVVIWEPTTDEVGTQTVVLRVADGQGGITLQSFTIGVSQPDTAPVIVSSPPGAPTANSPYRYAVQAQDAEGDPIAFSLITAPAGMSIDIQTGIVTWTPTTAQVGTQHVLVLADDGRGGQASQAFDLQIAATATNRAPSIAAKPTTSTWLGREYVATVVATDPDGDPLGFRLAVGPTGMTIDAAGVLHWLPSAAQLGTNPVEVIISDGRGKTATLDYSIVVGVQPVNHPPAITSNPAPRGTVDHPYQLALQASDPDGDARTWTLDAGPVGMSVNPATGALRWIPTADQLGIQHVVVRVTDSLQASATQAFDIAVSCVNLPPAITSTPPTTATVATLTTYAVRAVDPEGDTLTYSLQAGPAGMTIDPATGILSWTPTAAEVGTHAAAILVADGQGNTASQVYRVVVAAGAADHPPVITSSPVRATLSGQAYRYAVTASDPDGNLVTFSLGIHPDGMTIDQTSGQLTWTPSAAQLGAQSVTIVATDPQGATGSQAYTLSVRATGGSVNGVNHAPGITSTAVTTAVPGLTYHYDVRAADLDGDAVTYSVAGPAGMTIDNLGRITWNVAPGPAATYPVTVTATDSFGASDSQQFNLTTGPDRQPPAVQLAVSSTVVDLHSQVTIRVMASDNVGVTSLGLTLDGQVVALDASGSATVTLDAQEIAQLVGTATDAAGNVGTGSAQVRVLDPNDSRAPTVTITSPSPGAILAGSTTIRGTVAVGPGETLEYYTVEVARADRVDLANIGAANPAFRLLARGTAPVADGVLATFDPTLVADDGYVIRVIAFNTNGRGQAQALPVEVAGGAKLGNFHLAITDLSVPVAGIPIQVTRVYDTLNAGTSGDFGYGWSLGVRDAQIRETVPQTPQAFFSTGAAFRYGTRVYITAPDGTREGFTFQPYATGGLLGAIWHPKFVADPGVYDTLSVPDFAMRQKSDGTFTAYLFGFDYNPDDYTLTTTDGTKYQYNQFNGLQKVTDPNGNTLTYTANGITSSIGASVTFTRDGQGRITKITDPDGHFLTYRYDASGDLAAVTDADGMTTTYGYLATPAHFLSTATDALGHQTFQAQFDANGRLTSSIDALGNTASQDFDTGNFTGTRIDGLGRVSLLTYDARGNILTEADPLGNMTRYEYGDPANPDKATRVTDPNGHATTYAYDGRGNTIATTNALGQTYRATYNAQNKVTTATDPLGRVVTSIYDARGNLTTFVNAAGVASTLTYDAQGRQTSSTDNDGHTTTYAYATGSLPTRITNPDGTSRTIAYNALGLPTTITDELGHQLITTFDASGRVLTVRDAAGGLTRYVYDSAGNLASETDPLNHVTRYEYDAANRRVRTIDALGGVTISAYDAAGKVVSTTDANGHATTNRYDLAGRLVATTDALGGVTAYEYDGAGNRTAVVDALGNRRTYDFDALNRLVAQHDCLCATAYLTYDAIGNLASRTDRNGHATTFAYDALNRLVAETDALGGATLRAYDPEGNLVALTDANGHITRYEYDSRNRLVAETDPLGYTIRYGYDAAGNQSSITDQLGKVTRFTYDGMGRLLTTVDPDGGTTTNTYDLAGNLTAITDPLGRTIRYGYDALDRLVIETNSLNGVTAYTYDKIGNRTSLTDPNGNRTAFVYDALDRMVKETDPLGHATTHVYDAVGNETEAVDRNGRRRTFAYDILNRQTDEFWWVGTTAIRDIHTTYDFVGNVTSQTDQDSSYTFSYDALNRVVTVDNVGTPGPHVVLTSVYDAVGNRIEVSDNSGVTVGSTYDDRDQLTSRTWQGGGVAPARIDFAYDARGEQIGVKRHSDLAGTQRIGGTTTAYDDVGRTKSITHLDALDAVLASYDYTYDLASQLASEVRDGETIAYTNDATGQLTGADRSAGTDESYSFDPNGNRTGGGYVIGPNNQLLSDGKFNYSYDGEGNLVRKVEIATGNVTTYGFDYRDRLTEVVERMSSGVVVNDVQYVYDVLDRLITRVVNGQTLRTVYDGVHAWADYGSMGTATTRYMFGDNIDEILARSRTVDGTAWYLTDQLGTVRNIVAATGAVIDHLDYDSFGNIVSQTNAGSGDRFTYTGREYEVAIGLYYYRARFFDPTIGRFISNDPIKYNANDSNLYRYVNNVPTSASDPFGLEAAISYGNISATTTGAILETTAATTRVATIGSEFVNSAVAANENFIFARAIAAPNQLRITQGILISLGIPAIVLLLLSSDASSVDVDEDQSVSVDLGVVSLEASRHSSRSPGNPGPPCGEDPSNTANIAQKIANGHASKHLNESTFKKLGINNSQDFATLVQKILDNPSSDRPISNGRITYFDDSTKIEVIYDPSREDCGTAFSNSSRSKHERRT